GEADLRVERRLVVRAERAVVVAADGAGEEDAVLPGELLLDVEPEGLVLDERLVSEGDRGRIQCRDPRRRELTSLGEIGLRPAVVVLDTRRGLAGQRGGEIEARRRRVVRGEVGVYNVFTRLVAQG